MTMGWQQVTRADPRAHALARRHYSSQHKDSRHFVGPSAYLALYSARRGQAVWVTTWPLFAVHSWPGAWICSLFRNESRELASVLIRRAVAVTRWYFGEPPPNGMVTFVDERHVAPKDEYGACFLAAGFERCGRTMEKRLLALQLLPERMPLPRPPLGALA